jgi:hypothetical protein
MGQHVIALTVQGTPAYYAREGAEWDGCWFTREIELARTYKRAGNARAVVNSFGQVWADYNPTVKPVP